MVYRKYTGCKEPNCPNPHREHGYCLQHFRKWYRSVHRKELNERDRIYRQNNSETVKKVKDIWYINNRDRVLQNHRDNPEIDLRAKIKFFSKIGLLFNLSIREYRYALQSWSQAVKKRDNYTCQICGKQDKSNIAHHILHKKFYPLLSLSINNGITLCKSCHYSAHWGKLHAKLQ